MGAAAGVLGGSALMSGVNAYNQAEATKSQAEAQDALNNGTVNAQNIVGAANASASNATRQANNALRAATSSASNLIRSSNNNIKLTNIGLQSDTLNSNIARVADQTTKGTIDARIRASEQMGALMASAGAAGVGGGSVEALKSALNIQTSRQAEATKTSADSQQYDLAKQSQALESSRLTSLDLGQSIAAIDYNNDVYIPKTAPINMADYAPSPSTAFLTAALTTGLGGAAQAVRTSSNDTTLQPTTVSMKVNTYGFNTPDTSDYWSKSSSNLFGLGYGS